MGLQDRDYYKEKLDELEKTSSKPNFIIWLIVILIILSLLLGLLIF